MLTSFFKSDMLVLCLLDELSLDIYFLAFLAIRSCVKNGYQLSPQEIKTIFISQQKIQLGICSDHFDKLDIFIKVIRYPRMWPSSPFLKFFLISNVFWKKFTIWHGSRKITISWPAAGCKNFVLKFSRLSKSHPSSLNMAIFDEHQTLLIQLQHQRYHNFLSTSLIDLPFVLLKLRWQRNRLSVTFSFHW